MPFVIRLAHVDLEIELLGARFQSLRNVVERVGPIDFGLARPEQIEVGAVQHQDRFGHPCPFGCGAIGRVPISRIAMNTMYTDGTVSITVNGEHRRVAAGLSLAQLAEELGLVPEKVAVERNLEVVPRSTLRAVMVEDGDEIEIVHF